MTRWPAMMTRKTAAEYCDLPIAAFEREVLSGRLPQPVKLGGKDHWSKAALDNHFEGFAGMNQDWRNESRLYAS